MSISTSMPTKISRLTPEACASLCYNKTMNHYLAAALLMAVAIGFPMLCAAMGMRVNTRNGGWWD
jgi:hypothetical protein